MVRRRLGIAAIAAASAAGAAEPADGSPAAAAPEPVHATATGYVENRVQLGRTHSAAPVSTRDLPELIEHLEANVQLKRTLFSESHLAAVDASAILQFGALYADNPGGVRTDAPPHDVEALRPRFALSEAYLSFALHENLNLLVGQKRVVWGSGQAWNPMDVLNPPKDPTDPALQRAGAWMVRAEAPFERFTVTLAFVPQPLRTTAGIPYGFMLDAAPDSPPHYLVAARLYALVADADLTVAYFFSNRFGDSIDNRSRLGASFSRYFFTDYELHLEVLAGAGSSRLYGTHDCLTDPAAFAVCAAAGRPILGDAKRGEPAVYPRVLVGARTMLADESLLSVEYLYQADGYDPGEFTDFVAALVAARDAGVPPPLPTDALGVPQKFRFEPLRRHYLFATYMKPRVRDDWTVSAVLIASLEDLSLLVAPSVAWSVREWATLTLAAFAPVPGVSTLGTRDPVAGYTEYALSPMAWRVLFTARFYY